MKLELKKEFLEWSIGCGGRNIKRKLKNVHPSEFEKLYNEGYKDFFIVSKENLPHSERDVLKPIKKSKLEDDFTEPTGE